jgi:hypothetical protein
MKNTRRGKVGRNAKNQEAQENSTDIIKSYQNQKSDRHSHFFGAPHSTNKTLQTCRFSLMSSAGFAVNGKRPNIKSRAL